jgi:thiol:disulfide interchange protein
MITTDLTLPGAASRLLRFAALPALAILAARAADAAEAPAAAEAAPVPDTLPAAVAGAPWVTDFAAASVQAREQGRAILLNFTGSDWCVWCHRLRDEVFRQPWFLDYAGANLVLVEIDFPRRTNQPGALAAQNKQLDERFGVSGYPTIILLNADGAEIGRLGYMQGGSKTFVRELKRLIAADAQKRAEPAPPAAPAP